MAECTECMWWMSIDKYCLLTRDPATCSNNPARRGDQELVDRILRLPQNEREALQRRMSDAQGDEGDIGAAATTEFE